MIDFIREGTPANSCLRVFCGLWLAVLQCGLLTTACVPPSQPPPSSGDSGPGGDAAAPVPPGGPGGQAADLGELAGWWVVQRTGAGGQVVWGEGSVNLNQAGDEASFNLSLDDGSAPVLVLRAGAGGQVSGHLRASIQDIPASDAAPNSQGQVSADRATVTGTWTGPEGAVGFVLHRAAPPDQTVTGAWTRTDGVRAVLAFDGSSLLLSVLDAAGDWPSDGRYDVTAVGGTRLTGVGGGGFSGLFFGNRTRLHLQRTGGGGMVFDKAAAQSPMNGRWVGGDRRSRGDHPLRSVRIIVELDHTLYIHDSWDFPQGLMRTFRAPASGGGGYSDPGAGWSGRVSADGHRIVGAYTGWPEWYNSADRTIAPAPGQLSGIWSSISLDWGHHDPAGGPSGGIIRSHGTAVLTQTGNGLQITDTDAAGNGYRVEATWTGDRYEGSWWSAGTPGQTSPWRGELLVGGRYLHGTWNGGEYSFGRDPILESPEIPTAALGRPLYTTDPYEDALAVFSDAASGIAGTIYRRQDRLDGMTFATPGGELSIAVDGRGRPLRIVRGADSLTFTWAGAATAHVVAMEGGVQSEYDLAVDFSDAGVLAGIALAEQQSGRNLPVARDWLARNPGRVLAVVQGTAVLPGLARGLEPSAARAVKPVDVRLSQGAGQTEHEQLRDDVLKLSLCTILAAAGTIVATQMPGVSVALATAVIGGVCFTMLFLAGGVLMLLWLLYDRCSPCTLQCFVNCQ